MQRVCWFVLAAVVSQAAIVKDVRDAIAAEQFAKGESLIQEYRRRSGVTPEMIEAMSWLGRGALARKQFDNAEGYARETRKLALEQLKKQPLDQENHLPLGLGAAIEVQAHVMAARQQRDLAVDFLKKELAAYHATTIRTRIQKNINLLSLEGKPAPALDMGLYLGPKPLALTAMRGKPVALFFWAHWCGDCKYEGPILAKLKQEFQSKGLVVVAPTQRYGYVARGEDAAPDVELKYIEEVRNRAYADLRDCPAPVNEENFRNYGSSTTPTVVLIDRAGIVRLYHPGVMQEEELRREIAKIAR